MTHAIRELCRIRSDITRQDRFRNKKRYVFLCIQMVNDKLGLRSFGLSIFHDAVSNVNPNSKDDERILESKMLLVFIYEK